MRTKQARFLKVFSILALAVLIAACGGVEEKKMKFFDKGKALFEKGDFVKARLEFKNALQIDPKFAQGYFMLGQVEMRMKNPKGAFQAFSKAVDLDPKLVDAQIALGHYFWRQSRRKRPKRRRTWYWPANPEDKDALLLKASCLVETGKREEGEKILKALIQNNPKMPAPYLILARVNVAEKDLKGACAWLTALLEQDEGNRNARLLLASLLEQEKDLKEAEVQYKKLVDQAPEDANLKILLVRFYARNHQNEEAEKILKELVTSHPENPVVPAGISQVSWAKRGQGRHDSGA